MRQDTVFGCLSIVVVAFVVLGLFGVMLSEDRGDSQEGEVFASCCGCGMCLTVSVGTVAGGVWLGRQRSQSARRRPRSLIISKPLAEPPDIADLAMDGVIRLNYQRPEPNTPYCPPWLLDYLWPRGFRLARGGVVLSYFQMGTALTVVDAMSDPSLILATLNGADYTFVHYAGPVSDPVALATLRDAIAMFERTSV